MVKVDNDIKDNIRNEINEYEILLEHMDSKFDWNNRYIEGKIDGLKLALEYIEGEE